MTDNQPLTLAEMEANTPPDAADWLGGTHPCPYQEDINNDSRDWCFCNDAHRDECAADI